MLERVSERWVHLSAVFIVGWRQIRDVWRLLLVAGMGIVLAVILTIMLPDYSYLTLEARLHHIIDTGNSTITVSVDLPPSLLGSSNSGTSYAVLDQELRSLVQHQLGAYLQPQSWHAIQTAPLDLHSQDSFGAPQRLSHGSDDACRSRIASRLCAGAHATGRTDHRHAYGGSAT